ncbi:MAG TPA: hypothetical protein VFB79_07025 [Candidatus Angelobacter sp.]|nr:hypothetical protein [Candidatus Angelobacter sp.]
MKVIGLVFAFAGFVTGLIAAHRWLHASMVSIAPTWKVEPGETDASQQGWQAGTMMAFNKSGELNKKAAGWTAVAVALQTIGTFLLAFAD